MINSFDYLIDFFLSLITSHLIKTAASQTITFLLKWFIKIPGLDAVKLFHLLYHSCPCLTNQRQVFCPDKTYHSFHSMAQYVLLECTHGIYKLVNTFVFVDMKFNPRQA